MTAKLFKTGKKILNRRSLRFAGICLLTIALVIGFGLQKQAQAAWYDDSYGYRQKLTIGNTGAADSDKKVKFDIDTATLVTAGQMQSDCDDTRFTDSSGKVLQYYLDSADVAMQEQRWIISKINHLQPLILSILERIFHEDLKHLKQLIM